MRTDVKLGIVISMVVVLSAGGYFIFRGESEKPIQVAGEKTPTNKNAKPNNKPARSNATSRTADATKPTLANRRNHNLASNRRRPNRPAITPNNDPKTSPETSTGANRPESDKVANSAPVPAAKPANGAVSPRSPIQGGRTSPARTSPNALASRNTARGSSVEKASTQTPHHQVGTPLTAMPNVAVETHRVQPGDTLVSLAQNYYGSARFVPVLRNANPTIQDPTRLTVGTLVRIPPLPKTVDSTPSSSPTTTPVRTNTSSPSKPASGKRVYVVKPGDSFYRIAEEKLGDATRWKELLALNSALVKGDPKRLQVGQKVILPDS